MSHRHISLIIMLLCLLHFDAVGIERHYIRFQEKAIPGFTTGPTEQMPSKTERTSSSKGCIVMTFDESVPDSIRVALTAAKEAWEAKLPAAQEIYIQAFMEDIGNEIALLTDVYCEEDGCPQALESQKIGHSKGNYDNPDGIIFLNPNISWNCSFSTEAIDGYNAYTVGMRGIALVLGFGSSIYRPDDNIYEYSLGVPTYFDKCIHNGNTYLHNISPHSEEFSSYITSSSLHVKGKEREHNLYAPNPYQPYVSLIYLDDTTALMHYAFGRGDKKYEIDDNTIDILNGIGWSFAHKEDSFNIKCYDIAEDGIGSAYTSHIFSLSSTPNDNILFYNWKFSLKNKQGLYEQISASSSSDFVIDPIYNGNEYYVNVNGDLDGKIECEYSTGNQTRKAVPFFISLEQKPQIISIDNINEIQTGPFVFSMTCDVTYRGADNLIVEIEEDGVSTSKYSTVFEPYIAHVQTTGLSNIYYNWITIIVKNKYGISSETIEYAPIFRGSENNTEPSSQKNTIEIYNLTNHKMIFQGTEAELSLTSLPPGLYMKQVFHSNGTTSKNKIYIH